MNLLNRKTKYLALGSWLILIAGGIFLFAESMWSIPLFFGSMLIRSTLPRKNFDWSEKLGLSSWVLIIGIALLFFGLEKTSLMETSMIEKVFDDLREAPFHRLSFFSGVGFLIARAITIDFKYLKAVPKKDIERYYKLNKAEQ